MGTPIPKVGRIVLCNDGLRRCRNALFRHSLVAPVTSTKIAPQRCYYQQPQQQQQARSIVNGARSTAMELPRGGSSSSVRDSMMYFYRRRNNSSTSAPTSLSDATTTGIDSSSFPKPSSSANNYPMTENNHATIMNAANNNNSILDSTVIQAIIQDLKDADINNDKKVCYEELKLILSNYPNIFTPKDIDYISELFYVGKSGNSVPHTTFIRSLQYINQNNNSTYYTNDTNSTTTSSHLKSTESDIEKGDNDTIARDQTSALMLQQRKNPLKLEQRLSQHHHCRLLLHGIRMTKRANKRQQQY